MDIRDLCKGFLTTQRQEAVKSALADKKVRSLSFYGLAGSSAAMLLSAMPRQKHPMLVVAASLDDAGYLYHDISRILGEEAVLMFP